LIPESQAAALTISFISGLVFGFAGAIPPGPLNITVIRNASQGKTRDALRVAIGGALVDAIICGIVGYGLGWILEKVVTYPGIRVVLAIFLVLYGLKILILDRHHDDRPSTAGITPQRDGTPGPFNFSFLLGVFQGAANPAVFVNWTLFVGFLVSHGLFQPGPVTAPALAIGVGIGVFLWFLVLIELVSRLQNHPAGEWIKNSTALAGILLLAFGLFFTWKSFRGL
jgi:threonine/homoserine/homoserine lactone efflux protein